MKPALGPGPEASTPSLGEVLDFMRLVWSVDHALQQASSQMQATTGITGQQRLVMRIVGKFPGIPAGQLARLLHVHPSTLTRIVDRLEEGGMIQRRLDPRDRRRAFLGITVKGRQLDTTAADPVVAALEDTLARMSQVKLQNAGEVLSQLAESLTREREKALSAAPPAPPRPASR